MNLLSNPILEVALSLTLIYALLSIAVSILIEYWSYRCKSRGNMLRDAIDQLLQDPLNKNYGELLQEHFMIKSQINRQNQRPSQYLSSNLFAEALIDIIAQQARHTLKITLPKANEPGDAKIVRGQALAPQSKQVFERYKAGLETMNPSPLRDTLFALYDKADGNYGQLKQLLELWYNDYMDRVSGWYKSQLMPKYVVFGFLVAIGLNVDSLHLFKVLSMDSALRSKLVKVAENVAEDYAKMADSSRKDVAALQQLIHRNLPDSTQLDSTILARQLKSKDSLTHMYISKLDSVVGIATALNLPIGWNWNAAPLSWKFSNLWNREYDNHSSGLLAYNRHRNACPTLLYLVGIIISGFSLSFGAPFWFEVLLKLVNIRRAGKKPVISM